MMDPPCRSDQQHPKDCGARGTAMVEMESSISAGENTEVSKVDGKILKRTQGVVWTVDFPFFST